eukprot:TRINITY_DN63133_c0_g1_i1.p1 TRINITY_DN63133_c0_g1~~TRINITY_DN63133_c0_g1_i1.p1  ORF type:complete len:396 (-),score=83.67 TRINITY_DN63133_c0_g1_i1:437-1624(-)
MNHPMMVTMSGLEPSDLSGMGAFEGLGGGARASKSKKREEDDSNYTTVMLRNIPNKYTRQMLIDQLHRAGFRGDIDYLYLPVDFANRCNVGYCFINFRTSSARARFNSALNGVAAQSCLPGFNSYKICQVTKAKWQGREENIRRLRSGPELMEQLAAHPEWLPLLLDEKGEQEVFPLDDDQPRGNDSRRGVAGTPGGTGAAVRRPKRGQRPQPGMPGAFPGLPTDLAALSAVYAGGFAPVGDDGQGRGRGDRGGRRRPGRQNTAGGKGGGMPLYADPALSHAAAFASYAGSGMPMMPVMTEHGLQYMPYDGGFDGGYRFAFPMAPADGQMFGMPGMPFTGFPGYPGAAWSAALAAGYAGQGRGRGRGRGGFGGMYGAEPDDDEESEEEEDDEEDA